MVHLIRGRVGVGVTGMGGGVFSAVDPAVIGILHMLFFRSEWCNTTSLTALQMQVTYVAAQ
jgi:hypothetical protein